MYWQGLVHRRCSIMMAGDFLLLYQLVKVNTGDTCPKSCWPSWWEAYGQAQFSTNRLWKCLSYPIFPNKGKVKRFTHILTGLCQLWDPKSYLQREDIPGLWNQKAYALSWPLPLTVLMLWKPLLLICKWKVNKPITAVHMVGSEYLSKVSSCYLSG
jgi:hypothetical protein